MQLVEEWTHILSVAIESCAGLIIAGASIHAMILIVGSLLRKQPATSTEQIRLSYSRWLAVSLEFMLAGDILRTTIAPTWNDVGLLGAIVVLRTVLNYFLQLEIDRADERKGIKAKAPEAVASDAS